MAGCLPLPFPEVVVVVEEEVLRAVLVRDLGRGRVGRLVWGIVDGRREVPFRRKGGGEVGCWEEGVTGAGVEEGPSKVRRTRW